jgi:SAM-dependent methyltransferase
MPIDEHRAANLASWEERVPVHAASDMYGVDRFLADAGRISGVVAFDAPRVGDVRGKRLLHLQCHFGMDTLSWARLGAEVTGLDFSPAALAEARRIAEAAGLDARFVETELYDGPDVLDETFDVVYTGVGALNWLPDLARWADVIRRFLVPGGLLYLRESHPMLGTIDDARDDRLMVVRYPYFASAEPLRWEESGTYTDGAEDLGPTVSYEWMHPLSEVIGSLLAAGFTLTSFDEHDSLEYRFFEWMIPDPDAEGRWVLPEGRARLPLMYSLTATAPGDGEPGR